MSRPPFGFGPRDEGDGDDERAGDDARGSGGPPAAGGFPPGFGGFGAGLPGGFDPSDPAALGAALQQMGRMLQWDGGPVNWDLARDTARRVVSEAGDRSVGESARSALGEAVRLAELWLDGTTDIASSSSATRAWSRAEWVEQTLPAWKSLVEPVAARVVEAMGESLTAPGGLGLADGLPHGLDVGAMMGPLSGMLRSMGGAMFGAQVGQALGSLAGEVLGGTDVGLPLGPDGLVALVPANIAAFGDGLGIPEDQVRLWVALREAARVRLFTHTPWLRSHLTGLVEDYARGISVDTSALQELVGQMDPSDPAAVERAMNEGLFTPSDTPAQQAALARLETALALVEGWVDEVTYDAASGRLPSAESLRETTRRRRAGGGPAEQTFAALVGLELRPRRLRDAATLWRMLREARGVAGRDAVWAHPDLVPTASDLDDPAVFVQSAGELVDVDLSELERPADEPPGDGAPPSA